MSALHSIHGTGPTDVYAVGAGGTALHWDGRWWNRVELPTREDLRHVRCLASGEVWIAGATGTLLVGRQDRFRVVQPIEGGPDFHAVAAFVGGVYVAAGRAGVWSVSGNKVGPLKPNVVSTHLEVCGDLLRSVGDDLAVRCDGAAWFGGQFRFDG